MSDERGRGAADDGRPREGRDTPVPPEQPDAAEPEFGSADWLLQQLTGGRHVDRPDDVGDTDDAGDTGDAGDAPVDGAPSDHTGHEVEVEPAAAEPAPASSAAEQAAWPFAPPVAPLDAAPGAPAPSEPARPDQPAPFDELLGSAIEEPEAAEESPTEFPVAFSWNLTPGVGADPLVEEEPAGPPPPAAADAEPTDSTPADPTPTALFEPVGGEPVDVAPSPIAPSPIAPTGVEPSAEGPTAPVAAAPSVEPEPEPDAEPPLIPPVFRSTFVEPATPRSAGIFAPSVTPEEPSTPEPIEDEEPPAAVRSWVIEPALPAPAPAPEPEKPRTIFDAPEIPADDDVDADEQEGHGLAALLGFGAPESDAPSGRSVIGDTTSVIPIDPSAFTRPPAPAEPPATPIGDAILPPAPSPADESPGDSPAPFHQPVLPPIDAAALFEPPIETPARRQDAAEIADLLRAPHEEPALTTSPAWPPIEEPEVEPSVAATPTDRPDAVDVPTQQLDTSEIAALLRDEPVAPLPPSPAFPAAEAELAMGGLPSPATSPIDAESIASASEPELFDPEPPALEPDDVEAEESNGLAELLGDVAVEPDADAEPASDAEPQSDAGRPADLGSEMPADENPRESFDEAPEPAAAVEGPQLAATTPFTFAQDEPSAVTAAAATGEGTAPTAPPAAPTGGGLWGSRNNRILFTVAGAVAILLVLIGLFAIGTRIPSWLGAGAPAPAASAPASARASATPTPTPTPVPTVTPKPAAAVGPGTHPWDALGGGECVQPFTTVWAEEFTVVDCTAPHTAQLVYTNLLSADPAAPYPGADALAQQIPGLCTAGGVIDLGAAAAYPDLQVVGSFPATEAQWKSGQRSYYCFASRASGQPLTSSVAGPGPAA
ncbi:hypothetical protein [Leifsonia soli]|uniref:Septum formation-related domain-containing protein n=1 Tax=Leifsonia soli TaxID=582665 RepID=A0A852T1U7_9MICO|nr:hypothetical protein [Leifsonia soli]NYD74833.1 hypothetical protein [Leifsonia soli]